MKTKTSKPTKALSLLLSCSLLLTLLTPSALAAEKVTPPDGKILIEQTDYTLTQGVTETDVFLNESSGNAQIAGYMLTVSRDAKVTFKASYKGYYAAGSTLDSRKNSASNLTWGLESSTNQAKDYERATGGNVLAATNGDYYNMQTGQPLGYLIMEGNVVQKNNGSSKEPYFAVLKDGSYAIREFGTDCSDVQEAISGPFFLVRNGQVAVDASNADLMPRNSIGIKEDGTVVTFVADGRQYPYSVGMTIYDQACYLQKQGVVDAIYLDGGGSATIATKREGTSTLEVRNSPSDGVERTVSSALLLVSTANQDGVFDHASVEPNNQLYTPNSTVQFTASGVDAAGGPADLPEGVTWALADDSCGTISEDGLFTPAYGYHGDVTARLYYDGAVVGSTTVTIADITELYFTGDSISLDFGAQSDLGLTVKSNGRSINYKDGDFQWTVASDTDDTIGSVADNLFTAAGGTTTLTGTVTAAYTYDASLSDSINVEIGKMPVVLMDFEPDENGPLTGAHYHWGKSTFVDNGTIEGYVGNVSPITVITSGTYTGNPTTATLTAPYRFTGNWDSSVPASDIFRANGYTFYLWPNNSITTYGVGAVKTTTEEEGGHVRFDDYSLELNYDYSSYDGSSNSNFYLRYCGEQIKIEGYPTEIGVWVYVPEGSWEYDMYADLMVWNGSDYSTKNLQLLHAKNGDTSDTSEGNITSKTDWTGWRYCYADVRDFFANNQNAEHPISIIPGQGLFWLSYQPKGDKEYKGRKNGSLYYDNYRVVYGTNLDDLDNPMVDSITVNGQALSADGSTTIETNTVEIETRYHDVDGANKSGISANDTVILIDGQEVTADKAADASVSRLELTNGHHVVTVRVYDEFGNAAEMSRGFTVYNGDEKATSTVSIVGDDFVPLGGGYTLKVVSTEDIQEVTVTLSNLNADIGEPDVTVASGWEIVENTYKSTGYKKAALTLHIQKSATPLMAVMSLSLDDLLTKELAEITFHIDKGLDTTVNAFTYTPSNITYVDAEGNTNTAALPSAKLALSAYYTLKPGIQVEGQSSTITVLNKDGTPASGVTVYLNGTAIGATGADGTLETDAMKDLTALTEYTLSADGPEGVAEAVKATVMANSFSDETPYRGIHLNASENGSNTQSISYLGDPVRTAAAAYAKYRVAGSDGEWQTAAGTSTLTSFSVSKDSARVNTVRITGLTPDTTYEFQVGDGSKWADGGTFHTVSAADDSAVSFFVMGDTQMNGNVETDAEALKIMKDLSAILDGKDVDFGLQTGDYVDNGANLAMWEEMQEAFGSCYPATDIVHTLGNHEYYGNQSGDIANEVLQLPGRDYYSVEYGSVYVAVFNNSADLTEACQWLIEDAAGSSCQWKILAVHQPPYYTNATGGSERFNKAIPAAAEAAGIDVVFSGHDHSYARTPMLKGGEKVEENGVVYLICGDLGEKSRNINYAITSDFEYALATQEYTGMMLYVTAKDGTLSITAYDSANGGNILDSVTLKSACSDGHDYTLYDNGKVVCGRCGHAETPEALNFTGWLTVKGTTNKMYFVAGQYKTGWFTIGTTTYHFSDEGIMHETETVDTRTCTQSGALVTTCLVCGAKQSSAALWPEGHNWDDDHVCTKCGTVGRDIANATLKVYNATMDDPRAAVSATYNGEKLTIKSSQVNCDGYVTYSNNSSVGIGTVTIAGVGDYYGVISANYKITPSVVKTVTVGTVTRSSIDLSWTASKGATKYRVEISKDGGSTWSVLAYPTENKLTVTGLTPDTSYSFRLYGYTYVDGVVYSAPHYSPVVTAVTESEKQLTTQDCIADISAEVSGMTLPVQTVDGLTYLFLPASADLSKLSLTFTMRETSEGAITLTGSTGSVTMDGFAGIVDVAGINGGEDGRLLIAVGQLSAMPLYVMQSANVSALYITSDDAADEGRDFVDASKSNETTAQMKLVDEDGTVIYDNALTQVKARGNTTFANSPKKSYQIKLDKKTDLIGGDEKVKTWVLLAGYFDATQMHDKTFKDLADELGMDYVPGCDWVDLYYDGEYRGTYLLSEKNSVGSTAVDITDMEDAYAGVNEGYGDDETTATATAQNRFGGAYQYTVGLTEPDNITGGYLLELNVPGYDEASGFNTTQGASFNVKSPEWCGKDAMEYISEYYQEFENAVYATDEDGNHTGYNQETGKYYYEYCDLTSLVQMYLLEELASNVDGFYSSFYFYKDVDGIMYAGPVWDMECTAGTGWSGYVSPDLEFINARYLATALVQIPGFMDAVRDYYNDTFRTAALELTGSDGILANNAQRLADSTDMNYILWPYVRVGNPNNAKHLWPDGTTYDDVVEDMISWMETRIAVLDEAYPATGPSEPTIPVEPTEPIEPTEPTLPTVPTAPTVPVEPTVPIEPTVPVGPTEPTEPTVPVEPTEPTEPTVPVEPTEPVEPTVPVEPTEPTEPTVPVEPTKPTVPVEPTEPVEPTVPVEPTEPTEPTVPVEPTKPTEPTVPVEPTEPVEPTVPVEPTEPTEPTVPVEPTKPTVPVEAAYTVVANYYTNGSKVNSKPVQLKSGTGEVGSTITITPETSWRIYSSTTYTLSTTVLTLTITANAEDNVLTLRYDRTSSSSGGGGSATASYKLTFNTNGGSSIAAVSKTSGTTIDLSDYVPTRSGYTFAGWYSDSGLTTKVTSVKLRENMTVYAKWTKNDTAAAAENPFTDVAEGSYCHDAVLWAVEKGITNGVTDTAFQPGASCTRAQMVTFLWRNAGSPEPASTVNPFTDVSAGAYYYKAVLWAVEKGITNGTTATTFAPNATVTRGQTVTFLYRYANSPAVTGAMAFTDVRPESFCGDAVIWATEKGITNGITATTFGPNDSCTRGQIVTFLYRGNI